jgi:S1-C subfamily serine protease
MNHHFHTGSGRSPQSSLRRFAAGAGVTIAVTSALALAGCGGSSSHSPASRPATEAAAIPTPPTRPAPPPQPSTAQVIARASKSLVRIQGKDGAGSGFVVDAARQLVLTNAHVVDGNPGLKGYVGNDQATTTPIQVVASSPGDDLAVVKLVDPVDGLQPLTFAHSSSVAPGDSVIVLGYPGDLENGNVQDFIQGQSTTVTSNTGTVSAVNVVAALDPSLPTYRDTIEHQAPVNHGDSGGPLLDTQGQVVGVNALGSDGETQGQYYAIASDYVQRILPRLEAGTSTDDIGWNLYPISYQDPDLPQEFLNLWQSDPRAYNLGPDVADAAAAKLQDDQSEGLYVTGIDPASAADKAGLDQGDLLEAIDGHPVATVQDVYDIVESAAPGQVLKLQGQFVTDATGEDQPFDYWSTNLVIPRS